MRRESADNTRRRFGAAGWCESERAIPARWYRLALLELAEMKENLRSMLCQPCAHDSAGSFEMTSQNMLGFPGGVVGFPLHVGGSRLAAIHRRGQGSFCGLTHIRAFDSIIVRKCVATHLVMLYYTCCSPDLTARHCRVRISLSPPTVYYSQRSLQKPARQASDKSPYEISEQYYY